jgi:uncharacterized protein with HEPN domain
MNERDLTRLRDMLDAARKTQAYIQGKSREALEVDDDLIGFALIHAVQLIGEAASKVTLETRTALPRIQWQNIIGMRNLIVHDYLRVDYDIVWQAAMISIPELVAELEKLLPPETDDEA